LETVQELTKEYGAHPTQISQWKQRLREGAPGLFGRGQVRDASEREAEIAALYPPVSYMVRPAFAGEEVEAGMKG
jgi:transposase-like protein